METLKAWWEKPWPAIAAALVGIVATLGVGFWGLGWTSAGAAKQRADAAADSVRVKLCALQFVSLGSVQLAELKEAQQYNRDDVIRKHLKVVDGRSVDSSFARECAAEVFKSLEAAPAK